MVEQVPKEEILTIIKAIETYPIATQRITSQQLGFSLGKTNYLFRELRGKNASYISLFEEKRSGI